jgi:hypothetical protein
MKFDVIELDELHLLHAIKSPMTEIVTSPVRYSSNYSKFGQLIDLDIFLIA